MAIALWCLPKEGIEMPPGVNLLGYMLTSSETEIERLDPRDEAYDLTPENETSGKRELLQVYANGTARYRAIENKPDGETVFDIPRNKQMIVIERDDANSGCRRLFGMITYSSEEQISRAKL